MVALLPTGQNARPDRGHARRRDVFRILYLGRIENASKGVFLLPRIADEISDLPFRLTIVGDGPDLPALRKRFAGFDGRVEFRGCVPHRDVGKFLASNDAFLFPSYYEGMPMSLLEAMACGCVPVASRIRGVTDSVIDHGANGFLFSIGDAKGAARALRSLWECDALQARLARKAQARIEEAFSADRMAEGYVEALGKTRTPGSVLRDPIDPATWEFPEKLSSRLRQRLPSGLKNALRKYREILRAAAPETALLGRGLE
jgi:glycosyltransferase involved in cell wall biosynthesis